MFKNLNMLIEVSTTYVNAVGVSDGGVEVNVREGNYQFLDAPLTLVNEDSGTPNSNY